MNYIKICPRCGHQNDERASACAGQDCDELLLGIKPEPIPAQAHPVPHKQDERANPSPFAAQSAPEVIQLPDVDDIPDDPASDRTPDSIQKTRGVGKAFLTLQFSQGGRVFTIQDQQVLGRNDGSDDPNRVNIPADAGIDVGCVSRRHCRFHVREGQWYVTALHDAVSELHAPNPTWLGAEKLSVNTPYPLRHGDLLTLANIQLRIHLG